MTIHSEEDITWFDSIEDVKPEYTPIKAWSVLQFFTLRGKSSKLIKDNLDPIEGLYYLLFSPQENRYYKKPYRGYDIDTLYFYRQTLNFSGEDLAVENLRRYVADGNIWLLFNADQIKDTQSLLARVWSANLTTEGKLDYRIYIQLLKENIDYEDYQSYSKSHIGYRTVCNQFQIRIDELWTKARTVKK